MKCLHIIHKSGNNLDKCSHTNHNSGNNLGNGFYIIPNAVVAKTKTPEN